MGYEIAYLKIFAQILVIQRKVEDQFQNYEVAEWSKYTVPIVDVWKSALSRHQYSWQELKDRIHGSYLILKNYQVDLSMIESHWKSCEDKLNENINFALERLRQ